MLQTLEEQYGVIVESDEEEAVSETSNSTGSTGNTEDSTGSGNGRGSGKSARGNSKGKGKGESSTGSGKKRRDLASHEHGQCSYAWLKREAERAKIRLNTPPDEGGDLAADVATEWSCTLSDEQVAAAAAANFSKPASSSGSSSSSSRSNRLVRHTLSRSSFESTCDYLFARALEPVHRGLEHANVRVSEVDEVVLVGGSSRLLRVRVLLEELFQKQLRNTVDPDLAVAFGAALVVD